AVAWQRSTVVVAVVALCRWADAHRVDWVRSCRPCPRAYLLFRLDHRRGPSLPPRCSSRRSFPAIAPRSSVLRPTRTPAAQRSISPSAYTSRLAATTATQTGLSCSALLLARVLLSIPRRNQPHAPILV